VAGRKPDCLAGIAAGASYSGHETAARAVEDSVNHKSRPEFSGRLLFIVGIGSVSYPEKGNLADTPPATDSGQHET
jgi:hypothetical protein